MRSAAAPIASRASRSRWRSADEARRLPNPRSPRGYPVGDLSRIGSSCVPSPCPLAASRGEAMRAGPLLPESGEKVGMRGRGERDRAVAANRQAPLTLPSPRERGEAMRQGFLLPDFGEKVGMRGRGEWDRAMAANRQGPSPCPLPASGERRSALTGREVGTGAASRRLAQRRRRRRRPAQVFGFSPLTALLIASCSAWLGSPKKAGELSLPPSAPKARSPPASNRTTKRWPTQSCGLQTKDIS